VLSLFQLTHIALSAKRLFSFVYILHNSKQHSRFLVIEQATAVHAVA